MSKKDSRISWDTTDTDGFVLDGFVKANNHIIREISIEINPQTAFLYLILLSHRNTVTNACYPSRALLSRELGIGERAIGNMLTDLDDLGAIKIHSGKKGYANSYFFPAEDFYDDFSDDTFQAAPYRRKGKFKKQPAKASKIGDEDEEEYGEECSEHDDLTTEISDIF